MHLVAHKIFKRKGNNQILQGINLEVDSGHILVILGPSGSGKSHLLKILAGIERADSGDVFLQGESITKHRANNRNIGMVFDKPYFFDHLNIYQNMRLVLKKNSHPNLTAEEKIREYSEELHFAHLLTSMPNELTSMQLFTAQLVRALIVEPLLLIIDDPFQQIDGSHYNQMRLLLKKQASRYDRTLIVTTRSAGQAQLLANKLAIIDQGIIRQCATPEVIYTRPTDLHVANTIYTQGFNIIRASIDKRFKRFIDCIVCDRDKVRVRVKESELIEYDRDAIYICLRAIDFFLVQNQSEDLQAIQARLLAVESTEQLVYSHWQIDQDTTIEVHTNEAPKITIGKVANLFFAQSRALVFSELGTLISSFG